MTLRFSDGETFDTSGAPRVIHRKDGCYVIGRGHLIPCATREEAERVLRDLRRRLNEDGGK